MCKEMDKFVFSCARCAQSKTPRHLPAGKLLPLPTPNHPWPHIANDFLTDPSVSEGRNTILVTIDRFSRAIMLIALPQLPPALQTAEVLFQHVFRIFGIPEDIVSDRSPQLMSKVWRNFMEKLGITVNLSSGYHPQAKWSALTSLISEPIAKRAKMTGCASYPWSNTPKTP